MSDTKLKVENHYTYENEKEREEKRKQVYLTSIRQLYHKENLYYKTGKQ